ncbi:tRNA (cytosine-5-)-methyltransferase ncl1 [Elasticomyces elasticus]|nr:tRNA (cytosine-5-)-methyltransferase ncl1 [Elasticomyces elasticus]
MPRGKSRGGRGGPRGRGGRGRGRGGGGGGGGGYHNKSGERFPARDVEKINERFERYYNELKLVPGGDERERFWAALRRELPNSFRFCGSKGYVLGRALRVLLKILVTRRWTLRRWLWGNYSC